eukprot:gene4959-5764_t
MSEPRRLLPIFDESLQLAQVKLLEKLVLDEENGDGLPPADVDYMSSRGGGGGSHSRRGQFGSQTSNASSQIARVTASLMSVKKKCRIRVCNVTDNADEKKVTTKRSFLPRSSDYGVFIECRGTVIRSGATKILEKSKMYYCVKCKHEFEVYIDFEQHNQFDVPKRCPNRTANCGNTAVKPVETAAEWNDGDHCDYQEIKLQEQMHQLGAGSIPRSIIVLLQEDLVDSCQAGDDLTVSGIVIRRWKPLRNDERCEVEMVLLANHVRVMNEQRFSAGMTEELRTSFEDYWIENEAHPLIGRNRILRQVCGGVYGMYVVKLALLLVLIGGVPINEVSLGKRRGECHMLLVGEPGTGKSQFLKFAAKVASRSVLTTGIGTTSAGLTAAAVQEPGGEMVLEAGALVLADGGVCCIDEFSGISESDRATIHESMEQQTLSIAKAGIVTQLHTRTSIIAATNAKGKYDENASLMVNTNLASPLLSRFDVILVITDEQNAEWDEKISRYILEQGSIKFEQPEDPMWNMDTLQSYIYYVKSTIKPTLSEDSKVLLDAYFSKQRTGSTQRNEARITTRLLESLIRLSQAHARLMFRHVVEVQDAIMAIFMIENSAESSIIFSRLNAQRSEFPDDPDLNYMNIEKAVIKMLQLENKKIDYVPSQRTKSYPKPAQQKSHASWVTANFEEEEEEDMDDEELEEEEEEEEEEDSDEEVDYAKVLRPGEIDVTPTPPPPPPPSQPSFNPFEDDLDELDMLE